MFQFQLNGIYRLDRQVLTIIHNPKGRQTSFYHQVKNLWTLFPLTVINLFTLHNLGESKQPHGDISNLIKSLLTWPSNRVNPVSGSWLRLSPRYKCDIATVLICLHLNTGWKTHLFFIQPFSIPLHLSFSYWNPTGNCHLFIVFNLISFYFHYLLLSLCYPFTAQMTNRVYYSPDYSCA